MLNKFKMTKPRGFTLIELLVVIAIIGILATVILVSLASARSKARDTKRKNDLAAIRTAVELYHDGTGTYQIKTASGGGTGEGGNSWGWFNGRPGLTTIAEGLQSRGYFNPAPQDPLKDWGCIPKCNATPPTVTITAAGYMYYTGGDFSKYSVLAHLENPNIVSGGWDKDSSSGTHDGDYTWAGMNYRVGNGY